jgi:Reverse transcriptase (RNA-dependent DNA polymerase).
MFNRLAFSGIFLRLKFSEIKPIFYKSDIINIWNCRPISLLTSFLKIFEKVIFNRLCRHVNHNNILLIEQFRFRKWLSTELVSYNLVNSILSALNNKLVVGGIFCDLQKAFDCVNHSVLLFKIEFCGISGKANNLIKLCLQDRFRRVLKVYDLREYSSEWEPVKHGVSQGSIHVPYFSSYMLMVYLKLYVIYSFQFYLQMIRV